MRLSKVEPKSHLSSGQMESRMFDELFEGVPLSAQQAKMAMEIIERDSASRRALVLRHPHLYAEQDEMVRDRNRALRRLLTSEEQRSRFAENEARLMSNWSGDDSEPPSCGNRNVGEDT